MEPIRLLLFSKDQFAGQQEPEKNKSFIKSSISDLLELQSIDFKFNLKIDICQKLLTQVLSYLIFLM